MLLKNNEKRYKCTLKLEGWRYSTNFVHSSFWKIHNGFQFGWLRLHKQCDWFLKNARGP